MYFLLWGFAETIALVWNLLSASRLHLKSFQFDPSWHVSTVLLLSLPLFVSSVKLEPLRMGLDFITQAPGLVLGPSKGSICVCQRNK